jgi:anthranilate phosphoribosyltransferase
MIDPITQSAAELTTSLRAWLRGRRESPEAQAAAMAYEIAALVARHADSVPQACSLIDAWMREMKSQIRQLGVGIEHP